MPEPGQNGGGFWTRFGPRRQKWRVGPNSTARPKRRRFAASSDDGEGRNRTGDTTIFRDATRAVSTRRNPCKRELSRHRGGCSDTGGYGRISAGLGLKGAARSKNYLRGTGGRHAAERWNRLGAWVRARCRRRSLMLLGAGRSPSSSTGPGRTSIAAWRLRPSLRARPNAANPQAVLSV
jgi:hypothetical protein